MDRGQWEGNTACLLAVSHAVIGQWILGLLVGPGLEGSLWQAFGQIAAHCSTHATQLCMSGTVQYRAGKGIGSGYSPERFR